MAHTNFAELSAEQQRTILTTDPHLIWTVTALMERGDSLLATAEHGPTRITVDRLPITAEITHSLSQQSCEI